MKPCSPFPVPCSLFPVPSSLRRGSALLIVLGMVSFMVISSVAFSFYMRASRQPSSYLRTAVSGRYLLKSALANAIARIDGKLNGSGAFEGVYDDYYPGLVTAGTSVSDERTSGNWWEDRVFCPFGQADGEDVVATLTLEGLAYLPPAIINEVRWKARQTKTAEWQNLAYEVGRYAFCAVDVSDCFDVNKMRALGRTSGGRGRVGFSSLFRNGDGWSDLDESLMSTFNTKVDTVAGGGNIPFVSMADFNLYFGKGSGFSPFCEYIGKSGDMQVLRESDETAQQALFITDTWFPPTNVTSSARFNLAGGGDNQPFSEFGGEGKDSFTAREVIDSANATLFGKEIIKHLGGVGTVCLYDYLDADHVPTSLALPTFETAPMVCALGIEPPGGLKTTVVADLEGVRTATYPSNVPIPGKENAFYDNKIVATPYTLELGNSKLMLQGQMVFPFKRLKGKDDYCRKFKSEGLVRIFLAPAALHSRVQKDSPLLVPDEWSKDAKWSVNKQDSMAQGIVSHTVEFSDVEWNDDIKSSDETIRSFQKSVELDDDETETKNWFWKIEKYVVNASGVLPTTPTETWYTLDESAKTGLGTTVYTPEGEANADLGKKRAAARESLFANGKVFPRDVKNDDIATVAATGAEEIDKTMNVVHVAVWMKVSNADNNCVVDLVPAYQKDDEVWLNHDSGSMFESVCAADSPPVLRFSARWTFPFGISAAMNTDENDGSFNWRVLNTVDPRFNYAPEAWYVSTADPASLGSDMQVWLKTLDGVLGQPGDFHLRDRDVFMFTSDQEYLQSMGELQFLPCLRDLREAPSARIVNDVAQWMPDANTPKTQVDDVFDFMPGMWESYSAPDGDPIYNLGDPALEVVSSSGEFRVNPFTPDRRIFMAAIANTPYDWYVASTNEELNMLGNCDYRSGKPTVSDALKYAFNTKSDSGSAKWTDEEVDRICDAVRLGIRAGAALWSGSIASRPGWEHYFDRLAWFSGKGDDQKTFMGVNFQNPLHGVDRKFLHGFWRECFQNRQQLFLVFVRAEPLTVGGSGRAALANTQLGARGVALVWRDPEPPQYQRASRPPRTGVTVGTSIAPHRTRVLFYHQFD